jgi:cyclophilin family peptidyl-prolyl cis-trans isomerase/HEAT repeat protein
MRSAVRVVAAVFALSACAARDRAVRTEADAEAAAEAAAIASVAPPAAARDIAAWADARGNASLIVRFLDHPDDGVRLAAARALGAVGDPATIAALGGAIDDPSEAVGAAAAFSLGQAPQWRLSPVTGTDALAQAEATLLLALQDARADLARGRRSTVGIAVLRALGELGGTDVRDALLGALARKLPDPEVREAAALALGVAGQRGFDAIGAAQLAPLLPMVLVASEPARWAALWACKRMPLGDDARAALAPLLATAATSPVPDEAVLAIAACGAVREPACAAAITTAAASSSPRTRVAAMRASAKFGPELGGLAITALSDADPDVAAEAIAALPPTEAAWTALIARPLSAAAVSAAGKHAAIPERADAVAAWLVEAWRSGDSHARAAAIEAAGALPQDLAATALAAMTASTPAERLALAAAWAPREDGTATLIALLADPDSPVAQVAAKALGARPGPDVTAALVRAFASPDREVRLAVAKGLFGREDAPIDTVRAALADPEPLVRDATADALRARAGRSGGAPPDGYHPRSEPLLVDAAWGAADVVSATVETSRGRFVIALDPIEAPGTVANFAKLADLGYFDGQTFHRFVADFVIQGGDPRGDGWGGPGYAIRCEPSPRRYLRGTVGMALSGRDTGGSQWFVTLSRQPHLEGHYTAFGVVTDGMGVVEALRAGDRIVSVRITRSVIDARPAATEAAPTGIQAPHEVSSEGTVE